MPSTATSILDGLSTSVAVKAPCRTVATSNITLSGLQTISGYTTVEGDRVLVKGQTNAVDNGIYMASTGSWTRAKDADGNRDLVQGTRVIVRSATIDGVEYELTTANPIVIGTTSLTFTLRYGANAVHDQTEEEIAAGVIPVFTGYEPGMAERYGYLTDGVDDDSDTGTDNTTALQNCVNSNAVTRLPRGVAMFTNITLPVGHTIEGQGERTTTLRQFSTATGSAITFEDADSADISEGAFTLRDFCLKVATGSHGISTGEINASMLNFTDWRMVSQHAETLGSLPYDTTTNQRGIYVQSGATGSAFFASFRNVELRSFDIAFDVSGTVGANEWSFHETWVLDCRIAVRLSNCSTWNLSGLTVESGVENARCLQTFNAVSNIQWIGGRWELTQAGSYGIEGDGTTTGSNWTVRVPNVLIDSDGSAIPGRKVTGTVPNDFLFEGTDTSGRFMIMWNVDQTMRMPQRIVIGGQNLGHGRITIGRNEGSANATLENATAGHLIITGGNSVKLRGSGAATDLLEVDGTRTIIHGADGSSGWEGALRMGTNSFLWVDSTGDLRIKQGAPVSDLDGSVVGTQS
jgi:hypothetical protein